MKELLTVGRAQRAWGSCAIAITIVCLIYAFNEGMPTGAFYGGLLLFFVGSFLCLTLVRDLMLEPHSGWRRLTLVASLASGFVAPLVYGLKSSSQYSSSSDRMALMLVLAIASPVVVSAAMLYGRRLTIWVRAGFV